MRERREGMESPGAYVTNKEFRKIIFSCFLCSSAPLSLSLVAYDLESGGMPLLDAVGVNFKGLYR